MLSVSAVAAGVHSKAKEILHGFGGTVTSQIDGFVLTAGPSNLNPQGFNNPHYPNVDQPYTSPEWPDNYERKQTSTENQDSIGDYVNHKNEEAAYHTSSTQRSQTSQSQQDNAQRRTVSDNNNGNSYSNNNKNSDNQFPEGTLSVGSETDRRSGDKNKQPSTTVKTTYLYPASTSSEPAPTWPYLSPTPQPTRPSGGPVLNAPPISTKPDIQHVIDPNPILSPVDRVPIMIEYPKIDYDKVECECPIVWVQRSF